MPSAHKKVSKFQRADHCCISLPVKRDLRKAMPHKLQSVQGCGCRI